MLFVSSSKDFCQFIDTRKEPNAFFFRCSRPLRGSTAVFSHSPVSDTVALDTSTRGTQGAELMRVRKHLAW